MLLDLHNIADTLAINKDKHLYAVNGLPLLTVYDDNWFVRNDYDVLSVGQRQYVQGFLQQFGFKQKTGKTMQLGDMTVDFPTPKHTLALSSYHPDYLASNSKRITIVTPTTFAETLFYQLIKAESEDVSAIKQLINKCPYNIELLRDISYNSPIEQITIDSYQDLQTYQQQVVEQKFKRKKAL
ncbi:hypothetical protein [Thalassotalea marina]|uniref:Uncharacterized protein n=1 Tax=Thalassotalea marina TaxID=1673741 RepID=A0A919EMH5_9GAMM|nr:hypothetical protein [Thalassotalea marina]GHF99090.1 hypothetical protein GCM10017161_29320 [Thalassotalea marina]